MKVIVSIDAAEHIKKKSSDGASVRIAVIQIKSGWCSTNQLSVEIGYPGEANRFDEYKDNGVSVFIQKGLRIPDELVEISLKNYLLSKTLVVKGIRY